MRIRTSLIVLIALLTLPLNVQADPYPITWNPKGIEQTLGLGSSKDFLITMNQHIDELIAAIEDPKKTAANIAEDAAVLSSESEQLFIASVYFCLAY